MPTDPHSARCPYCLERIELDDLRAGRVRILPGRTPARGHLAHIGCADRDRAERLLLRILGRDGDDPGRH